MIIIKPAIIKEDSMEYTICGDLHCKPDNLDKVQKLFMLLESLGLPVIMLGDTLDTKELIRGQCMNLLYRLLKDSKLHWYFIIGNHCWFNLHCQQHSLEVLKSLENVTIIDKPTEVENVTMMPFYSDYNVLPHWINNAKGEYLIAHLDVKGFNYGNGIQSNEGLELADLSKFKKVISGHYHEFQQNGNLLYLGTPFSHSFGESNQDKYLAKFNSENGNIELIKTDFPRHVTVELDLNNPVKLNLDHYDHNRIIIKGTREQLDAFDSKPYEGFKIIQECVTNLANSALKETQSHEEIYEKWYKDVKKETDPLLFNLGLKILREVK